MVQNKLEKRPIMPKTYLSEKEFQRLEEVRKTARFGQASISRFLRETALRAYSHKERTEPETIISPRMLKAIGRIDLNINQTVKFIQSAINTKNQNGEPIITQGFCETSISMLLNNLAQIKTLLSSVIDSNND